MNANSIPRILAFDMPGVCPAVAPTQAYPTKLMRPVTPFPAGCGVDFIGRIVAKGWSE